MFATDQFVVQPSGSPHQPIPPKDRRAVRGKNSSIGKADLVGRDALLSAAWIDGRRLVDSDPSSLEQVLSHKIGEPQDGSDDAIGADCNAQQRVGEHCGEKLQADCIVGRVDQTQNCRALAGRLPVELVSHQAERLGKSRYGTPLVGIRQGRPHRRIAGEMVMMLAVGVPVGFQPARGGAPTELRLDLRHQMVPAPERFVVGIAVVTLDDLLELTSVDVFKQLSENARCKAHAPFLF